MELGADHDLNPRVFLESYSPQARSEKLAAPVYLSTIQQLAGQKYLVLRHILEATRPLLSKGVNSGIVQVMLDSTAAQLRPRVFRQGQVEKDLNESALVCLRCALQFWVISTVDSQIQAA